MGTLIMAIAVLGLLGGSLYTLFKPRWAILFIIILYPLEQLLSATSVFFASHHMLLNIIVGVLAIVGAASAFLSNRRPLRGYMNPVWLLTVALYAWAVFGIMFSPDKKKAIEDFTVGLPYLGLLLVFPGLLVNDVVDFRRLLVPTMVIGTAIIVLIITSPNTTIFSGRLGLEGLGPDSKIQNPLATATLGGTIVIIAALFKPTRFPLFVNLVRLGALGSGLAIAMLSGSRGQLLGAGLVSLLMFPFARRVKNIFQFVSVSFSAVFVLGLGYLVLSLVTTTDAASRWDMSTLESGLGSRWSMITTMLGEFLSSPMNYLQGLGTSSFQTYWTGGGDLPYVHNMPVQILTEHGLIGATLLMAILVLVARASYLLMKHYRDDPGMLSTAAIIIAICMYQLLLSFKQGSFFTSAVPFWWFLVLSKVYWRTMKDFKETELSAYDSDGYGLDAYPEAA